MTKVNPNNGNETKSDIFPRDIFGSDFFSLVVKYQSISISFIIGTLQSHCKSEPNQVK